MLQIEHLSITHTKDLRPIVEDLSLILHPGDRAAVIGEEGNGKSTLLKLLYDEDMVSGYAQWTGRIHKNGLRLGYLPQEPEDLDIPADAFWQAGCRLNPGDEARLLGALGLSRAMVQNPRPLSTLSGGERVKLSLARVLAGAPDVLLLDEPSNDLDLDTLQWLEEFLLACPLPALFVSHDESLIRRCANVIVHLEALRRKTLPRATVAQLSYDQYVEGRQAKFLHQAQVSKKEHDAFRQKMERFRQIRNKVEHQQATISRQDPHGGQLLKKKMHAVQSMGRRFEREKERLTQMPELEEAIFLRFPPELSVPRGKTVLDFRQAELQTGGRILARNLDLKVTGPEKIGIIGPNGCGKTTLLRLLAKELEGRRDIRAVYMPQNYAEGLNLTDNPVSFLNPSGSREEATRVRNYLGALRFTTREMSHPMGSLSGGQKAKIFFLKMILEEANVLVLDEPTRNFSPLSGPVIRQILRDFGGAVISVSHDRLYLEEVCQKLYALTPAGLVPL